MRNLLLFLLLPIILAVLSCAINPKQATFRRPALRDTEVLIETIQSWTDPVLWIDARDEISFSTRKIPGAVLLNSGNFERNVVEVLNNWIPSAKIVVYCDSELCDNSREIADKLRNEMGLPDVYELYGGWDAWLIHQES